LLFPYAVSRSSRFQIKENSEFGLLGLFVSGGGLLGAGTTTGGVSFLGGFLSPFWAKATVESPATIMIIKTNCFITFIAFFFLFR